MNILEQLRTLVAKQRVYASFFKGGSKDQEELAVVRYLLESMAARGEERFFEPSASPFDPPDCVARNADGAAVAIEVTEVVCEQAVRVNAQRDREAIKRMEPGVEVMRNWNQEDFIAHVSNRLADKDMKKLKGGPYGTYVVAMLTDELELERDNCEAWLQRHAFGPFKQVGDAYLLFSYTPDVGYAYLRIKIAQQTAPDDAFKATRL
jgi:hypothetical protein